MKSVGPRGLLVMDKPSGPTSHDMVVAVRRRLKSKAGHTGTLDPQATGVLPICVGPATRLARFLQHQDKVYDCTIRFGWATDSYDGTGEPLGAAVEPPTISPECAAVAVAKFTGETEQIPPVYSSKKIRGEPAYRRARRGETVETKPIKVRIFSAEIVGQERHRLLLRVHCGPGTYMRSLAHDLGAALGCPAHLESLRRVRSGPFGLEQAMSWTEFVDSSVAEVRQRLLRLESMLPEWPVAVLSDQGVAIVANGGVIEPRCIQSREPGRGDTRAARMPGQWVRVLDASGTLLAAAEALPGGLLQPRVVLG